MGRGSEELEGLDWKKRTLLGKKESQFNTTLNMLWLVRLNVGGNTETENHSHQYLSLGVKLAADRDK